MLSNAAVFSLGVNVACCRNKVDKYEFNLNTI